MRNKNNRVGEKHITKEGYEVEVIEYIGNKNCTIQFENGYKKENILYKHVKEGEIKNPYHKSIFDVGYLGDGMFITYNKDKNKKYTNYSIWQGMLQRCYNEKEQEKNSTYKEVTVCEEWHNFQNFAKWFEENFKNYMQNWHLDKDILIKGNKIYSPNTCCFVPQEVNKMFMKTPKRKEDYPRGVTKRGENRYVARFQILETQKNLSVFKTPIEAFEAYKIEKEKCIKEVADRWKPFITPETYQAMYNYQVEITD